MYLKKTLCIIIFLACSQLAFFHLQANPTLTQAKRATHSYQVPRDTTIYIQAITGLQYSLPRFAVSPGAKITLVLENADDMAHNLVITRPEKRLEVVHAGLALGAVGPKINYIPDIQEVLWGIPVLEPGQKQILTFTAPQQEAVYPYVCTYPGHGFIMYGAMYVTTKALPPLANDPHIPENQRNAEVHTNHPTSPHPYEFTLPALYRTFMPDCSPAAIAVGLPSGQSYCWDAGQCRLRYAWKGGFVDNSEHWKGNGNALSKVVGEVYYRDLSDFPLRIGKPDKLPETNFKGYKLLDRYPEFSYEVDGVEVTELIKELEDKAGLVRQFTVVNARKPVYFVTTIKDGVSYQTSTGKFKDGVLKLSPAKAKQFTITMLANKNAKLQSGKTINHQ